MGVCLAAWLFMHMPSSGGVRRETLRGVHKIQVGVWGGGGGGELRALQQGPGQSPGGFRNYCFTEAKDTCFVDFGITLL